VEALEKNLNPKTQVQKPNLGHPPRQLTYPGPSNNKRFVLYIVLDLF
jgi:hypothetical protein